MLRTAEKYAVAHCAPPAKKKFDLTRSNLDLVRSDNLFTLDITRSDWHWLDLARYNQVQ